MTYKDSESKKHMFLFGGRSVLRVFLIDTSINFTNRVTDRVLILTHL